MLVEQFIPRKNCHKLDGSVLITTTKESSWIEVFYFSRKYRGHELF